MYKCYNVLLISITIICLSFQVTHAQRENVWTFGARGTTQDFASGLDFKTNPPSIFGSTLSCSKGSATICDTSGNLLFYTDGSYIVRANGDTMPNGYNLTNLSIPTTSWGRTSNTETVSQNSLIIPMPDSPSKYYIFSLTSQHVNDIRDFGKLFYSIVNMDLDNGKGDVEMTRKGIFLDSNLTEHMAGVVGDRCNVWVTVASNKNRDIKSFEITTSGINTYPIISPDLGPNCTVQLFPHHWFPGIMRFSPGRGKLVMTNMLIPGLSGIYNNTDAATLYDFNPVTGMVSNAQSLLDLSFTSSAYGAEFSPDGSKVYINGGLGFPSSQYDIYQFDLDAGNSLAIKNSKVNLGKTLDITEIKAAPNGKLYFHYDAGMFMGTISAPNISGLACQFLPQAFSLMGIQAPGPKNEMVLLRNWKYGLPNAVPVFKRDTIYNTTIISGDCNTSDLKLKVTDSRGWNYQWNDGSEDQEYNSDANGGTFWVTYHTAPCIFHVDSFTVEPWFVLPVDLGPDTIVCGKAFRLDPETLEQVDYEWQDGSTGNFYDVFQSGAYWVKVSQAGCHSSDTVRIEIKDIVQDLGPDQLYCDLSLVSLTLKAQNTSTSEILWNTGNTNVSLAVSDTGLYWVKVSDPPCADAMDTLYIGIDPFCACNVQMPTAFSPNGDGINDVLRPILPLDCPVQNFALSIYNRFGQRVFFSTDPNSGWNGMQNGLPAEISSYAYELRFIGGTNSAQQHRKGDVQLIR